MKNTCKKRFFRYSLLFFLFFSSNLPCNGKEKIWDLSHLRNLTDETANEISEFDGLVILSGLVKVEERHLLKLASGCSSLQLNGIINLTKKEASILSTHGGRIILSGIKKLELECIEEFVKNSIFEFPGVKKIGIIEAYLISYHSGCPTLYFPCIESLDPFVIPILSLGKGNFYFDSLKKISLLDSIFIMFSSSEFSLNGLNSVSDLCFYCLCNNIGKYTIELNGLNFLSKKQDRILFQSPILPYLRGLENISEDFVSALHRHQAKLLILPRLKKIDSKIAKKIASSDFESIDLDGLEVIDDDTSYFLGLVNTKNLSLNGLKKVSYTQAINLARCCCSLGLSGINEIDLNLACILASHYGGLSIDGVKKLDLLCCKALQLKEGGDISCSGITKFTYEISLLGKEPTVDCILFLRKNKIINFFRDICLLKKNRGVEFSRFFIAIYNHRRGICLNGIKKISNEHSFYFKGFKKDLYLNGLEKISNELSKNFYEINVIYLNGIKKIDDYQALMLGKNKQKIYLDGLESISKFQFRCLAKTTTEISFKLVQYIDVNLAHEIIDTSAFVDISGVRKITLKEAEILSLTKHSIRLGRSLIIDNETKEVLDKNDMIWFTRLQK